MPTTHETPFVLKSSIDGHHVKTISDFIAKPVGFDLMAVPGIGEVCKASLCDKKIFTEGQLLAAFLAVRPNIQRELSSQEATEYATACAHLLHKWGVHSDRSLVVTAVASKLNNMFPGYFPIFKCVTASTE